MLYFNNSINNLSIEIEYTSLSIKIASININSLLQPNKKLTITKALNNNTYDILGISETHLSTKEEKILNNQINNYQSFWSTFSHTHQAGVGIFIHQKISKYIARIHNYKGHIISLDLHFKNSPIRLLQVYIPIQEKKQLCKEIQEYLISLLQYLTYKIIIIGDFNGVLNAQLDQIPPKKNLYTRTSNYQIFNKSSIQRYILIFLS